MTHPPITIVILTYARAACLEEALCSALQQDYPNFNVLVLNDNIHQSLEIDNAKVGVVNYRHKFDSLGEKRNEAFALADGEWLTFLDDDDLLKPWHLSAHMDNALTYPHTIASICYECIQYERKRNLTLTGTSNIDVLFKRNVDSRFPEKNVGEDKAFRRALTHEGFCSLLDNDRPSYIYCWDNGVHHTSYGEANTVGIAERRMKSGEEPTGTVKLVPRLRPDIAGLFS